MIYNQIWKHYFKENIMLKVNIGLISFSVIIAVSYIVIKKNKKRKNIKTTTNKIYEKNNVGIIDKESFDFKEIEDNVKNSTVNGNLDIQQRHYESNNIMKSSLENIYKNDNKINQEDSNEAFGKMKEDLEDLMR